MPTQWTAEAKNEAQVFFIIVFFTFSFSSHYKLMQFAGIGERRESFQFSALIASPFLLAE